MTAVDAFGVGCTWGFVLGVVCLIVGWRVADRRAEKRKHDGAA